MPEAAQIEIRVQFPVDSCQQIQIKGRRHARGIVVRQQLHFDALFQVRAEQQRITRLENRPHLSKESVAGIAIEIADRASQKQHE